MGPEQLGGTPGSDPKEVLADAFLALQRRFKGYYDNRYIKMYIQSLVRPQMSDLGPHDYADFVTPVNVDVGSPDVSRRTDDSGIKLKPGGSPAVGLAITMPDRLVLLWMTGKVKVQSFREDVPYSSIRAVNDLTFTWKLNTMVGLEFHSDHWHSLIFPEKADFTWSRNILHKRLDGTFVPLYKGSSCVRWVNPNSENDPKDETGIERHYPYQPSDGAERSAT